MLFTTTRNIIITSVHALNPSNSSQKCCLWQKYRVACQSSVKYACVCCWLFCFPIHRTPFAVLWNRFLSRQVVLYYWIKYGALNLFETWCLSEHSLRRDWILFATSLLFGYKSCRTADFWAETNFVRFIFVNHNRHSISWLFSRLSFCWGTHVRAVFLFRKMAVSGILIHYLRLFLPIFGALISLWSQSRSNCTHPIARSVHPMMHSNNYFYTVFWAFSKCRAKWEQEQLQLSWQMTLLLALYIRDVRWARNKSRLNVNNMLTKFGLMERQK